MESWENCMNQAVSDPNQASQAGFSVNNTWLKKIEW
jgi:transcriptional regulator of acetoin/glycerol metabolism